MQIFEDEEQTPLLASSSGQCSSTKCKDEKHTVIEDVIRASDLDLFMDYNFLVISIGLAFVYAVSIDFSSVLPELLSVS